MLSNQLKSLPFKVSFVEGKASISFSGVTSDVSHDLCYVVAMMNVLLIGWPADGHQPCVCVSAAVVPLNDTVVIVSLQQHNGQ